MGLLEFESSSGKINKGIRDGELIDYVIIDIGLPKSYIKKIAETNKKKKDENEALGEDYIPIPPTYKEGGIEITIAAVRRELKYHEDGSVTGRDVFLSQGDKLVAPDYNTVCRYQQMTPRQHFNAAKKDGSKYGDWFRGCGREDAINNKPIITGQFSTEVSFYPPVSAMKDNSDPSVKWDKRISADNIPIGEEYRYKELMDAEDKRQKEWQNLFKLWDDATEEERKVFLLRIVSKRLLICKMIDNKFHYLLPEVGMFCRAMVNNRNDSSYFNIKAFGFFSKEEKRTPIYSTCSVSEPDEENKDIVKLIKQGLEDKKNKSVNQIKEIQDKIKKDLDEEYGEATDDDDDPPFDIS